MMINPFIDICILHPLYLWIEYKRSLDNDCLYPLIIHHHLNHQKMSKKAIASKVIDAKKEESVIVNQIPSINLSKFAKELEGKGISHLRNERETIYIYPFEWKSDDINGKKGRQFRNHKRSFLKRLSDNLFFLGKGEKIEEMKAEILKFEDFYKSFYKINDYSLKSLSSSNDPAKNQNLDLMLRIIAEIKSI